MLAKITGKNQITLPKAVMRQINKPEYVDVSLKNGSIILTPVHVQAADAVRNKLEALGITEQDIGGAVAWSRGMQA